MGDLLRNALAYFVQGIKDCFYGLYEVYIVDSNRPQEKRNVQQRGVLAQRRAAQGDGGPAPHPTTSLR